MKVVILKPCNYRDDQLRPGWVVDFPDDAVGAYMKTRQMEPTDEPLTVFKRPLQHVGTISEGAVQRAQQEAPQVQPIDWTSRESIGQLSREELVSACADRQLEHKVRASKADLITLLLDYEMPAPV